MNNESFSVRACSRMISYCDAASNNAATIDLQ